jgi:hypothetical protein
MGLLLLRARGIHSARETSLDVGVLEDRDAWISVVRNHRT